MASMEHFGGAQVTNLNTLNGMMLQGFSWYLPADGQHWRRLAHLAPRLLELGYTSVWMPPAYKGQAGEEDVGYGVYDLWDLGEFDQKGSVRTKYGTRRDYLDAVRSLRREGLNVLADVVLNHRMGADEAETVSAIEVAADNRTQDISDEHEIRAWTKFTFPGRNGVLNKFVWDWRCFHGIDWDEGEGRGGIWRFHDKTWDDDVSHEMGNYDYLMGADVDLLHPRVYRQLVTWGRWYLRLTGADGVRLDAVKHMSREFYRRWLADMRSSLHRELFCVGEYWSSDVNELLAYLGEDEPMSLFDVPLHFRFFWASTTPREELDLRGILDATLVAEDPVHAVTFVDNHDTQPSQALESTVQPWFKPLAYAIILLREAGYPCVFFADLYGLPSDSIPMVAELPLLMELRRRFAYGPQSDCFAERDLIGWTRAGDEGHPQGLAVILCTRDFDQQPPEGQDQAGEDAQADGQQEGAQEPAPQVAQLVMNVGAAHAGETWRCVLGNEHEVVIGDDGSAAFMSRGAHVCVYLQADAAETLDNIPILT